MLPSRFSRALLVIVFAIASAPLYAQQQESGAQKLFASMPMAKQIGQAAISPDGRNVAFVSQGHIYVVPADSQPRALPQPISVPGDRPAEQPTWSHDSRKLVFIAEEKSSKPAASLWVTDLGGTPRKLADFQGDVADPSFSPDDKTVAVLFIEGIPRQSGPLMPMTPPAGVIEEHFYEQRLTTIDVATNAVKQVSPADMYIYEYDWMPDGKGWATIAAHGSGDNNWWIARLYTTSLEGAMKEIYKPKLQIAEPRVSPDGRHVAFIEGLMSDEGSTGGDIFIVPVGGGEAKNLTPGMKASASSLHFTSPTEILFGENIDGDSGIAAVSTSGDVRQLWHGPEVITGSGWGIGFSVARDGHTLAFTRQSYANPPELWAGNTGALHRLTSLNANVKPAWGEAKNVNWQNGDMRVQGWLLFPRDYDKNRKYPMIVTVHGGPSSACTSRFNPFDGMLSAAGYFVLCPNPRGSFGQGEAFTQANIKDFGGGDFKDIMAGIDALGREYPIDLDRLGIHGHSYGGYMTMWAETQTNRFKAAVAGAGLSDWTSYYGLNDIDQWMIPFFGASVYDDPAVYAKSDPIRFVKNVKTPTLILVGDRDGEVPETQSQEWWHALRTFGVPVRLVVYEDEGHAISKPKDRADYQIRTLEWFDQWLAPKPQ